MIISNEITMKRVGQDESNSSCQNDKTTQCCCGTNRENLGTAWWYTEVSNDAEMVTCPDAVYRLIEGKRAGSDSKRGSTMKTTAHENVIDSAKRPIPICHKGILGCK